jgi:hypothetical protein
MNHFTFCFLFISIFSVFALSIAYWVGLKNGINPIENYKDFLFATTIGTFTSTNQLKCIYGKLDENNKVEFNLACPIGEISQYRIIDTRIS